MFSITLEYVGHASRARACRAAVHSRGRALWPGVHAALTGPCPPRRRGPRPAGRRHLPGGTARSPSSRGAWMRRAVQQDRRRGKCGMTHSHFCPRPGRRRGGRGGGGRGARRLARADAPGPPACPGLSASGAERAPALWEPPAAGRLGQPRTRVAADTRRNPGETSSASSSPPLR